MYDSGYVKVKPFKHVGQDERGVTQEFSLSRQQQEFVYITRKKNTLSGNTYHLGKSPATNPKTFVLLTGEIELYYRFVDATDTQTVRVQSPALIEVKPETIHAVKALTDIVMLEANSISDIQQDLVRKSVECESE